MADEHRGYCTLNCCQCPVYRATIAGDTELKKKVIESWRNVHGRTFTLAKINCRGCKSDEVFFMCRECPWRDCCRENEIENCLDCQAYPCENITKYLQWVEQNKDKLLWE